MWRYEVDELDFYAACYRFRTSMHSATEALWSISVHLITMRISDQKLNNNTTDVFSFSVTRRTVDSAGYQLWWCFMPKRSMFLFDSHIFTADMYEIQMHIINCSYNASSPFKDEARRGVIFLIVITLVTKRNLTEFKTVALTMQAILCFIQA